MASIAVLIDMEEGHLLSSFWISRPLKEIGHRVFYLGHPSSEEIVRRQGFEFIPIQNEALHRDFRNRQTQTGKDEIHYIGPLVRGEILDDVIADLRPDLALILSLYYTAGLAIHYRYQLPIVFFTPDLRKYDRRKTCESVEHELMNARSGVAELVELLTKAGAQFRSLKDIAQLTLQFPEIKLLPEAFDLPGRATEPRVYYVGAGIDTEREEDSFFWPEHDSSRPLIYCARGSQSQLQRESGHRFFQIVFAAALERPEWRFLLATGKEFGSKDFPDAPPNVAVSSWVPQLKALACADVMVNHGGFGTVKECILMQTPMVVLPAMDFRDHSASADRVVYHGLGVQRDITQVTPTELILLIEQVLSDSSFKHRLESMREKFLQQDGLELAVRIIEDSVANGIIRNFLPVRSRSFEAI